MPEWSPPPSSWHRARPHERKPIVLSHRGAVRCNRSWPENLRQHSGNTTKKHGQPHEMIGVKRRCRRESKMALRQDFMTLVNGFSSAAGRKWRSFGTGRGRTVAHRPGLHGQARWRLSLNRADRGRAKKCQLILRTGPAHDRSADRLNDDVCCRFAARRRAGQRKRP